MLTKDEKKLFLAICKFVRHMQDIKAINSMTDSVLLNNWEIRKTFADVEGKSVKWHVKKTQAVAYSLQEKGFVKISKSYKFRGKYISIDTKGIEYIQYLKTQMKK